MIRQLVSVVIPTWNEEKNIEKCLEGINNQTYPKEKIEIIVVDKASTDKTKAIAKKYAASVFNKGPERSAQRNYGANKSSGKYVICLDADMILSPTVIAKSIDKLEESDLIALYIPEIVLGNTFWSHVRRFERSFYDGTAIDCVRIIKRDIFEEVGGFDPSLTGPEDWDFDKKIRGKGRVGVLSTYDFKEIDEKVLRVNYREANLVEKLGRLTSRPLIYHNEAKFDIQRYLQKKKYYVKCFGPYIDKWGKDDSDNKKQFGFWYRYFGVFIENRKWKRFLRYPALATGVFLLRFLVGVSFIVSRFK